MTVTKRMWVQVAGAGFACFLALGAADLVQAGRPGGGDAALGRQIFEHNWARPDELDETLGTRGDGLGPLFNDVSCVACHGQGGTGGAGANERNAVLMSIVNESSGRHGGLPALAQRAQSVHFGFEESSTIVLHKFGLGSDADPFQFDEWRANLLASLDREINSSNVLPVRLPTGDVEFEIAQRNTPALWGLGLVEEAAGLIAPQRIARSVFRENLREKQQRNSPWISGRIPRTAGGQEGWFGWRGQTDTLDNFVRSACANELGLEVPGRSQPGNPVLSPRERLHAARGHGVDLNESQCRALTAFVKQLPRPQLVLPESPEQQSRIHSGERNFLRIGCADCHVPEFAGITGFYSDMLLHDMGNSLADLASANPELDSTVQIQSRGGYSGGGSIAVAGVRALPCDCEREWKTPPLWGVADSAPYLHDGRAETLQAAIMAHDGEAAPARYSYTILSDDEQSNLLTFLDALRAPLE